MRDRPAARALHELRESLSPHPVKRGYTFTHAHKLDMGWKPGPGQKYRDGPKARMVVTRTTRQTVWFTYDDGKPGVGWLMDRAAFEAQYGPST